MVDNQNQELRDVALLVRHVPSADCKVARVTPDQPLQEVQTLMSAREFSQIDVISDSKGLEGAVSWRSITQARLTKDDIKLSDATFPCRTVHLDDDLLKQIDTIYDDDFAFVRRGDGGKICGIITTADLTKLFRDRTTQFFQVADSEGRLRRCIDRVFDRGELRAATKNNKLESAADMMFFQYKDLLRDPDNWKKMQWKGIQQDAFISYLDAARNARNKVMHFDKLDDSHKRDLEYFFNLMRTLDPANT